MHILQSSFSGPQGHTLNGPMVIPPAVNHALICLHGFGSSGDDLIALAPVLQASLGNLAESIPGFSLAIYSPTAPTFNPSNGGYQWFRDMGWTFRDADGLARVAVDLDGFIAQVASAHNIPTQNIALLGFSQGAMTVLHALPTLTHKPAAVISCSGALTVTPPFPATENPQPILFVHGEDDDVLPADTSVKAAEIFAAHGYPTQVEILPDLGHGIDAATIAHISVFLQSVWSQATPEEAAA